MQSSLKRAPLLQPRQSQRHPSPRIDRVAQTLAYWAIEHNPQSIDKRDRVAFARVGAADQCVDRVAQAEANPVTWARSSAKGNRPGSIGAKGVPLNHQARGVRVSARGNPEEHREDVPRPGRRAAYESR